MVPSLLSLPRFLGRGLFGTRNKQPKRNVSFAGRVSCWKRERVGVAAMKTLAFGMVFLAVFFYIRTATSEVPLPFPAWNREPHHKKYARRGAVATLSTQCSKIGADILEDGGNAADATIAMEFCVGVIGMASTGLGGGGFALVRHSNGSYQNIDFRETAPAAATEDMFEAPGASSVLGGLASGIPGELRGLEYLFEHYASRTWESLIRPSIDLADNGFPVTEDLVYIFSVHSTDFLIHNPAWSVDFAPNGTLVGVGDILTRKRLAELLRRIAKEGPDVFYTGDIAEATVAALQAANGTMTVKDLEDYAVTTRTPLEVTYKDYKLVSCGAPSSGAVVLNVMKIMEGYDNIGDPAYINITTHRLDEAIRFGYGARTQLGDPSFFTNISTYEEKLIADNTATIMRSNILDTRTQPIAAYDPLGIESLVTHGTSHVVAADSSGLVISLTSTVNLYFGSKLMVPSTGLIMNNEMDDFSTPGQSNNFGYIPSPSNFIRPGKRPQSSMAPVIVEFLSNSTFYYALGGVGGSYIITAVIEGLHNVLDRKMGLAEALKEPRFHDQLVPNICAFEYEFDNATVDFMVERGHNVTWESRASEACELEVVRRLPNGTFEAAGEPALLDAAGYAV